MKETRVVPMELVTRIAARLAATIPAGEFDDDLSQLMHAILSAAPAADGVVVPRGLLDDLAYIVKCTANEMKRLIDSEAGDPDGSLEESALHLEQLVVQADAILSTDSGIERAEGKS